MTLESILFIGCGASVALALAGAVLAQVRYSQWHRLNGLEPHQEVHITERDLSRSLFTHSMVESIERGEATLNHEALALLLEQLKQDEAIVENAQKLRRVPPNALIAGTSR